MTMTPARAANSLAPQRPLPDNVDLDGTQYQWATHVHQRCQERSISPFEVVATIKDPEIVRPYKNGGPGEMSYYRGDLRVGFIPAQNVITTVMGLNGDDHPRTPLVPQDRMHLIERKPEVAASPVVDWDAFKTSTDCWADFAAKHKPGDEFDGKDFIKYYQGGTGGRITDFALKNQLTQARERGELLGYSNGATPKGRWKFTPVETKAPRATGAAGSGPALKVVPPQAAKTGTTPPGLMVASTGGKTPRERIEEHIYAARAIAAKEPGIGFQLSDADDRLILSVTWHLGNKTV